MRESENTFTVFERGWLIWGMKISIGPWMSQNMWHTGKVDWI